MADPSAKTAEIVLEKELKQCIDRRTGGQVHGLHVEVRGDRVMVSGRTRSYYLRQLVTVAVLECIEHEAVDFDLRVDSLPDRPSVPATDDDGEERPQGRMP